MIPGKPHVRVALALAGALALGAWVGEARADPQPRCINFSASTGTSCSAGMNDAEIEGGTYFNRLSSCPDTTLSTDGHFHCLEARRRSEGFRDAFPTDESVIVDPDGKATAANLMTELDTTFADASATRFELNVSGHAGQRLIPPRGVDLAINAFQEDDDDPSSFTARDLLGRIGRHRTAIGDRPVAMTFDTCFSGAAVEQFALYTATTENPANVCAIGSSGEDEFSRTGASLSRVRMRLRSELDCEPSLNEVYRQAMRTNSMPSVPTLTSNALLGQYQRAKANTPPDAELITVGDIGAGIATLPCASGSLLPAPAPIEGLGTILEGINQRIMNAFFTARLTQMQGDALYLLREAGIRGCGTIAADGSDLDATKIACFTERLNTQYAAARERMATARDRSIPRSEAIKARYDRRQNLMDNLFDEMLGLPHPARDTSNLGSGGDRAIRRAFEKAKKAVIAKRKARAAEHGTEFTGTGNLVTRDAALRTSCGREFDSVASCVENTPSGTPTFDACTSVRDTEIRTRIGAAGCEASSPHRSNPSNPSPREACETAARTAADTEVATCRLDCQERILDEFSPCRLALEPIHTLFRKEIKAFMDSEKVAEAAAVNATYADELTIAQETKRVRRAAEQLSALSGLRTLATDTSATGRRFQELYADTATCEGFDARPGARACMRD